MTRSPSALRGAALVVASLALPVGAEAQLPGLPVLQNAFSNPGVTVAANYGSGDNSTTFGVAGAWAPSSGRFQFSAGVGSFEPDEADRATAYGVRFAAALFSFAGGSIGAAPFLGVGGANVDGQRLTHVPVGVGLGWRRALGQTRAISLHASPFFSWWRQTVTEGDEEEVVSKGLFRASVGADVSLFGNFGATAGLEAGSKAKDGDPGPLGTVWGVALSYAFR
jgi:hypothetical protein